MWVPLSSLECAAGTPTERVDRSIRFKQQLHCSHKTAFWQKEALSGAISNIEISSIDGFQGREADIVIFVTVRCNVSCDIGFLAGMRRLNVVMTRAKCGVVIIGSKSTLTGCMEVGGDLKESKRVWQRLVDRCQMVPIEADVLQTS